MASWKKVIVSGSQAHLQSITASGDVLASGNLSITGISTLTGRLSADGAISTTNITASGNISSTGNLSVTGTSTLTGRLTADGAITTTNITASGNISSTGNLSVTGNITASGLPQTAPDSRQVLMIDSASGAIVRVTAASLSGSVGVDSFRTISIGGVGGSGGPVVADNSTDTLNINSSDVNLTIVGDSGTDTITFDFADSPIFTHITASGNISSSGNLTVTGNSTIGGTLGVTGLLNANGALTTTNLTATGNISASGNLSVTGNITASGLPQTAPDSRQVLMIDSASGAIVRVTAASLSGSVGVDSFRTISIGGVGGSGGPVVADNSTDTLNINSSDVNLTIVGDSGTDTITFDFADSPIFTHITASGNISSSGNLTVTGNSTIGGNLIVTGSTTLGDVSGDSVTVNAQTVALANQLSATALSSTMLVITSSNRVATQTLGTGVATFLNTPSASNLAAAVTDKTGTGNLVFSSSPTFTGTIGAAAITTTGNVVIGGDLTVNGDTTILNTTELLVEDKFIILASGSIAGSPQDSGIIIQTTTGSSGIGSGSALFLNGNGVPSSGTSRWGLAQNIPHNAASVTPTDYIMSVSSSAADPTLAPTYGSASAGFGNVHINTQSKTIWMYI